MIIGSTHIDRSAVIEWLDRLCIRLHIYMYVASNVHELIMLISDQDTAVQNAMPKIPLVIELLIQKAAVLNRLFPNPVSEAI